MGYVKKNFLAGLELTDFSLINPAVRQWLDTVANVRLHGSTKRRPIDLFAAEKPALKPLPSRPYDLGAILPARANSQFRVILDTNAYSVPAQYAGSRLTLKAYPDHLCIYHQEQLIARHVRRYDRHQDVEDPDHPRALLQERRRASDQKLLVRFLNLTPKAEAFYRGLEERRLSALQHVRRIVALSEIYGTEHTARAIHDALGVRGLQLPVHRQPPGTTPASAAPARRPAPHPPPGPAGVGTARTEPGPLRRRGGGSSQLRRTGPQSHLRRYS